MLSNAPLLLTLICVPLISASYPLPNYCRPTQSCWPSDATFRNLETIEPALEIVLPGISTVSYSSLLIVIFEAKLRHIIIWIILQPYCNSTKGNIQCTIHTVNANIVAKTTLFTCRNIKAKPSLSTLLV